MAYSDEQKNEIFDSICDYIVDGLSLRAALKAVGIIRASEFFRWMKEDETKSKSDQYARATDERAEFMFEEILDIADEATNDYKIVDLGDGVEVEKLNAENIQRSRLRVDARKWHLSKVKPKKYGDKLALGGDPENPLSLNSIPMTPQQAKEYLDSLNKDY